MDILIPLCGKGERFVKDGYTELKPMIKVCGKPILYYLLDNLFYNYTKQEDITVYLVVGQEMNEYIQMISLLYPEVNFLKIKTPTRGAAETVLLGLQQLGHLTDSSRSLLLLDGDTFYKNDIVSLFHDSNDNKISKLATFKVDPTELPHYSYSQVDENERITMIAEKIMISQWANTGAYYFASTVDFLEASQRVINTGEIVKGEYYTSVVISNLINTGYEFRIKPIDRHYVVSLGTPRDVQNFIDSNYCYLFDLDGTLVSTDHLYLKVWEGILSEYGLHLTEEIFNQHVGGKNDSDVAKELMLPIDDSSVISKKKDDDMIECIVDVKLYEGVNEYIKELRRNGYVVAIVTNSNRRTASEILKVCNINYDLLITASDVEKAKPDPEPYLKAMRYFSIPNERSIIFEDSKSGILSGLSVSPACIVGIIGTQMETELYNQGCHIVIPNSYDNSLNEKIEYYINHHDNHQYIKELKTYIMQSLKKTHHLQDVIIEVTKMKGGYIADVLKVQLILTNGDIKDCVLKLESKNENMLSNVAQKLDLYNREYYFYEVISKYVSINVPLYIGTVKDTSLKTIGILLEYIDLQHYEINVNLNKTTIETTLEIVDKCAEFHAWSWNKDITMVFPYLKKHDDRMFYPEWSQFINEKWTYFTQKWERILSNKQISLGERICKNYAKIQKWMSTGHLFLCHGDVKSPNIFIHKKTKKPVFIDWQYIIFGKGVADIVFLMIESLDIKTRHERWELLLQYYYIKLLEHGVKDYTPEEFKKDTLLSMCHFPFFVAIWFGTVETEDLIDKNFPFMFIRRYFSIIEQHEDDLELLFDSIDF